MIHVLSIAQSLLRIDFTMFLLDSSSIVNVGVPWLDFACEDLFDFFQSLASSLQNVSTRSNLISVIWQSYLGETEEHMNRHSGQEHAEDYVSLPLDVDERRWDEVGQSEVEDPVCRGAECDGFASNAQRVELWGIDPADRTPGWRKRSNKQIGEGNHRL